MEKFLCKCAHCPSTIELGFWELTALNRPYGEYYCDNCHKKSCLPDRERSHAFLVFMLCIPTGAFLSIFFDLNPVISYVISLPIFMYLSYRVGKSNLNLIKHVDPLNKAKERPLIQNLIIYALVPLVAVCTLMYLVHLAVTR